MAWNTSDVGRPSHSCRLQCLARRALAPLEIIGGVTHILFWVLFIVTLAVMAPRSTASFVFTQTLTGLSGGSSVGIQWNIGLLSAVFPLGGGFSSHLAECLSLTRNRL